MDNEMDGVSFWDMCGERFGVSSRVCSRKMNMLVLSTVAIS